LPYQYSLVVVGTHSEPGQGETFSLDYGPENNMELLWFNDGLKMQPTSGYSYIPGISFLFFLTQVFFFF
jgi:hypothetical protein